MVAVISMTLRSRKFVLKGALASGEAEPGHPHTADPEGLSGAPANENWGSSI